MAAQRGVSILQRGRSHGGQVIVITQSVADIDALTGQPGLLASLTDNFSGVVAHRQTSPESRDWLAKLMGTRALWQTTSQTGTGNMHTGRGSARRVREFRISSDTFGGLGRGEAVIYTPIAGDPARARIVALTNSRTQHRRESGLAPDRNARSRSTQTEPCHPTTSRMSSRPAKPMAARCAAPRAGVNTMSDSQRPNRGDAGESAEQEYERRSLARRRRARERYGPLGTLIAALAGEPHDVYAWKQGAQGEAATARALDRHLRRSNVVVLHDRRIPGRGRANIDHIAIGPGGITVIDTKSTRGQGQIRTVGLVNRREHLLVNGRDRSSQLDALERQLDRVATTLDRQGRRLRRRDRGRSATHSCAETSSTTVEHETA